jgi:hypothetical protein
MRGALRGAVLAGLTIFLGFAGTANAQLAGTPAPASEAAKPVADAAAPVTRAAASVTQAAASVTQTAPPASAAKPPAHAAAPVVVAAPKTAAPVVDAAPAKTAKPVVSAAPANTAKPVVDTAANTAKPVVDTAKPVVDTAANTAKPVVDQATQLTSPVVRRATETADAVLDTAAPVVDRATQAITPIVDAATLTVTRGAGGVIQAIVAPAATLSAPIPDQTIVPGQPAAMRSAGSSGWTPRDDRPSAPAVPRDSATAASGSASAPMTTVPPAMPPAGDVAGMTVSSQPVAPDGSVPAVSGTRIEVLVAPHASAGELPVGGADGVASARSVAPLVAATSGVTSHGPAAPQLSTGAPAPSAPATSSPGGGIQAGAGTALLLLALLAGLAALVRPTASWRIHLVPASWRPAPYLALLDSPG